MPVRECQRTSALFTGEHDSHELDSEAAYLCESPSFFFVLFFSSLHALLTLNSAAARSAVSCNFVLGAALYTITESRRPSEMWSAPPSRTTTAPEPAHVDGPVLETAPDAGVRGLSLEGRFVAERVG